MKKTLARYEFEQEIRNAGRYGQFGGAAGCGLLFDYLTDLEATLDEEIECDLAAFAGEFEVTVEGKTVTLKDSEGETLREVELLYPVEK